MVFRAEILAAAALPFGLSMIVLGQPEAPTANVHVQPVAHEEVSFAEEIMPIFEEYCTECHGAETAELGLNLATYEGTMAGSDYGTVIEAGNVAGSLLIDMVESGDMPDGGDPVPADKLELIKTWVLEGAPNN